MDKGAIKITGTKAVKPVRKAGAKSGSNPYLDTVFKASAAEEPATATYSLRSAGAPVFSIVSSGKAESNMTSLEKMDLSREGITKRSLEKLKKEAGLDYNQLSKILSVARTTLINKKGSARFATDVSEKIVGLAEIFSYGYEVFEDKSNFNKWLFQGNKSLGGKTPFDLLDNTYGREEVKSLIGRIDHGVYS